MSSPAIIELEAIVESIEDEALALRIQTWGRKYLQVMSARIAHPGHTYGDIPQDVIKEIKANLLKEVGERAFFTDKKEISVWYLSGEPGNHLIGLKKGKKNGIPECDA